MPSPTASEAGRVLSQARMEKLSPAQRKASTAAGRAAFEARFDAEVDAMDPQRKMSADERARRIREARSAYFSRIATKRQSS